MCEYFKVTPSMFVMMGCSVYILYYALCDVLESYVLHVEKAT